MKKIALLLVWLALSVQARAETYSYEGGGYDQILSSTTCTGGGCVGYAAGMRVTGTLTTRTALGPNLSRRNIQDLVVEYSFTDGLTVMSSSDANVSVAEDNPFVASTDDRGRLVALSGLVVRYQAGVAPHARGERLDIVRFDIDGTVYTAHSANCAEAGAGPRCPRVDGDNTTSYARRSNDAAGAWTLLPPELTRTPIYRFYDARTGTHFYTGAAERDQVIATLPQFQYDGLAFYAYAGKVDGTLSVHRFYDTLGSTHFYTINGNERDYIAASLPNFRYEGVAWNAQPGASGTAVPVYRFFRAATQSNFDTTSEAEKAFVQRSIPSFAYVGIAYYAWTTR